MSQNQLHSKHYKILAVAADCSWDELRKTYKKQIQKWHPDRFEGSSEQKEAADEKIKQINIAYNEIAKYYRQHGELPLTAEVNTPVRERTEFKQHSPAFKREAPSNKNHHTQKASKKTILILILLSTALYGVIEITPDQSTHRNIKQNLTSSNTELNANTASNNQTAFSQTQNKNKATPKIKQTQETEPNPHLNGKYFTIGSSVGEVISAQGAPTRTEKDAWYYGDSVIYFNEGSVVSWERTNENPLRARLSIH